MKSTVKDSVDDFFKNYPAKNIEKNQILIHAGDTPSHIIYLESGRIQQYDISSKGEVVVVNIFTKGAFFPMSMAINQTKNQYFFETLTDVTVRKAPNEEVVAFVRENKQVAFDLLSRVYRGLDGLIRRMAHLMGGSAKSRLLFELLIECKRFGQEKSDGSITVRVSETELASRTGMTRETVSRQIHDLKREGLVSVSRGTLTVFNVDKIQNILGTEL